MSIENIRISLGYTFCFLPHPRIVNRLPHVRMCDRMTCIKLWTHDRMTCIKLSYVLLYKVYKLDVCVNVLNTRAYDRAHTYSVLTSVFSKPNPSAIHDYIVQILGYGKTYRSHILLLIFYYPSISMSLTDKRWPSCVVKIVKKWNLIFNGNKLGEKKLLPFGRFFASEDS